MEEQTDIQELRAELRDWADSLRTFTAAPWQHSTDNADANQPGEMLYEGLDLTLAKDQALLRERLGLPAEMTDDEHRQAVARMHRERMRPQPDATWPASGVDHDRLAKLQDGPRARAVGKVAAWFSERLGGGGLDPAKIEARRAGKLPAATYPSILEMHESAAKKSVLPNRERKDLPSGGPLW
jgi:hypothetical protein